MNYLSAGLQYGWANAALARGGSNAAPFTIGDGGRAVDRTPPTARTLLVMCHSFAGPARRPAGNGNYGKIVPGRPPLKFVAVLPIRRPMELLALVVVFAISCALAVAAGHGVLRLIFRAMTQLQPAASGTNPAS